MFLSRSHVPRFLALCCICCRYSTIFASNIIEEILIVEMRIRCSKIGTIYVITIQPFSKVNVNNVSLISISHAYLTTVTILVSSN